VKKSKNFVLNLKVVFLFALVHVKQIQTQIQIYNRTTTTLVKRRNGTKFS